MNVATLNKEVNNQPDKVRAIAKEFASKVKDNAGVAGVVAKSHGNYLNLIVVLDLEIPRDLEDEVYDAYGEIFDKYDGEVIFEFDPVDCFASDTIDQIAYDDAKNIIYRSHSHHHRHTLTLALDNLSSPSPPSWLWALAPLALTMLAGALRVRRKRRN